MRPNPHHIVDVGHTYYSLVLFGTTALDLLVDSEQLALLTTAAEARVLERTRRSQRRKRRRDEEAEAEAKAGAAETQTEVDGEAVAQLVAMGFEVSAVTKAMRAHGGDMAAAADALLSGDLQAGGAEAAEEEDERPCDACGKADDAARFLLCDGDGCKAGWHLGCLTPPLQAVPEGDWFCPKCVASGTVRSQSRSTAGDAGEDGSSDDDDREEAEAQLDPAMEALIAAEVKQAHGLLEYDADLSAEADALTTYFALLADAEQSR